MNDRPRDLRSALPGLARMLRHFRPHLRQHRVAIAASFGALFSGIALRLLEPWPVKFVFDALLAAKPRHHIGRLSRFVSADPLVFLALAAAAIVIVTALRALSDYFNTVGFARVGTRVMSEVRLDFYRHLQRLSLAFHATARSGDLILRVMGDVNLLREIAVTAMMPLLANICVLAGMIVVMFWLDWKLALLSMATLPLFGISASRLSSRIRDAAAKQRRRDGALAASAAESIAAIKLVQALSLEDRFAEAFRTTTLKSSQQDLRISQLAARLERSVDLLIAVSTALVVFYGGLLALRGELTAGDLYVFLTYLRRAFNPVQDFAKYTGRLAKASAAGDRIIEVLDQTPDIQDLPGAVDAPPLRGDVELDRVSFAYTPGAPVLENVSFSVPAGTRVALVGPSGIGKSTLLNLLLRLYEPVSGRVMIDGRDIREYTIASLRKQASVVLQETVLFAAPVWENIGFAAPEASHDDIIAAATLANAHDFIVRLPQGYATVLGERGVTLSGGERQRLAVARAAIRNSPLLVLDEPTTALDEENERLVLAALDRISEGRTTFLVTHDIEFASRSDVILYLEGRKIAESGSHDELIRRGGRYAALFRMQREGRHAVS